MSLESPLNAAHQHAANADDFMNQGLIVPASEEHYKAAEAFAACIQASSEENTKRTLRMLYNEHSKAGKELQRKIAKLREEGKDPSLPQKSLRPATSTPGPSVVPPQPTSSPPPTARNNLSDSQQTVEESFMLLGQRSEGSDAFNTFWRITEGMLHHLSQPVAFATAPLGSENATTPRREGSGSDTDVEDPVSRTFTRNSDGGLAGITTFPPKPHPSSLGDDWDEDELDAEYDNMADSFCLIPSKSEPTSSTLTKENLALRAELEEAQKQLASANRILKQRQEQDLQLRDSIMLARKEAQRAMTSSMAARPGQVPDLATLNINTPLSAPATALVHGAPRDREAQLLKRIRDLEEEVRGVRIENEKQKAMIVKFRDRWDKVKESHKRKKQAQAQAEATSVAKDRIQEEPEAEAQAEEDDLNRRVQPDVVAAAA
ncbi:hypothetical protein EUX98_g335 [Antrodiella citrinella]|uniref:Uncharacterized protein n=1 Tax=Antrodiella citrinella TaxID=2447956 RepID=A0A4S4N4L3_9APHY|nr:hypothetical protein EUX98_g335 [Antrodiella citrinella]